MSKPFIIVCGAPKLGKSTEVFKTFQNSLAIVSSTNNAHYYKKLLTTQLRGPVTRMVGDEEKTFTYKPPKRIKLIDTHTTNVPKDSEPYSWDLKPRSIFGRRTPEGTIEIDPNGDILLPVPQIAELEKTIFAVVTASSQASQKGEPPPYDNLIIDEWGEFLDRVYSEVLLTVVTRSGEPDGRKAFGLLNEWVARVINQMKQLSQHGVGVCLVCHDREPDEGKKGGAKAPSAGIANKMTGMADGAIQRVIKDPEYGAKNADGTPQKPKRLWKATASEKWNVGLRGIEPEDEDLIAELELYDILTIYAGYDL
jgi:hypothetical protein